MIFKRKKGVKRKSLELQKTIPLEKRKKQKGFVMEPTASGVYHENFVIAVTGMSSGSGCTFIALNLALELSSMFKVALVELDEKNELQNFQEIYELPNGNSKSKRLDHLDVYFYETSSMVDILKCKYDFIILDTGCFIKEKENEFFINENSQEIYRANKKLVIADIREWKRHRVIRFLEEIKDIKEWTIVANLASNTIYLDFSKMLQVNEKNVSLIKVPYIENIFDDMDIAKKIINGGG